jgi:hypothetical protein
VTRWDYGDEGRRFPVEPRDVWTVGAHWFACGDILDLDPILDSPVTLVYTDPPWQQGNVNSFRTKAGLPKAEHSWLDLYRRIVELAGDAPCWIEGGVRQAEQVQVVLPGPSTAMFEITYYRKHPCVLHYSGPVPPPVDPTGVDDEHTPAHVLAAYEPGLVLDLCAGRGLTARAAYKQGWDSFNVELGPHRVSAALARLSKATLTQPTLLMRDGALV